MFATKQNSSECICMYGCKDDCITIMYFYFTWTPTAIAPHFYRVLPVDWNLMSKLWVWVMFKDFSAGHTVHMGTAVRISANESIALTSQLNGLDTTQWVLLNETWHREEQECVGRRWSSTREWTFWAWILTSQDSKGCGQEGLQILR